MFLSLDSLGLILLHDVGMVLSCLFLVIVIHPWPSQDRTSLQGKANEVAFVMRNYRSTSLVNGYGSKGKALGIHSFLLFFLSPNQGSFWYSTSRYQYLQNLSLTSPY